MYDRIVDIALLEKYYYHVRLSTKYRIKILNFEMFYMTNIIQIYEVLKNKQYKHSEYNVFLIYNHFRNVIDIINEQKTAVKYGG